LLSPALLDAVSIPTPAGLALAPRVGESSLSLRTGVRPRGVHVSASPVGVEALASREGVVAAAIVLVGEGLGVVCLKGDGDRGDSGRRKGDARGEP
jgi:hypothetical protein